MNLKLLPWNAPFVRDDLFRLDHALCQSSMKQRAWLAAHLAGHEDPSVEIHGRGHPEGAVASSSGEVVEYVDLNSSRSELTTMHIAIALDERTPEYEPGSVMDLLGIDGIEIPSRVLQVASSRREVGDEVHALMVVDASAKSIAERIRLGSTLTVRLRNDSGFRLPPKPSSDVVMVGVEEGVAPFRAFIQERRSIGSTGRSWLFFGGRRFTHDFLYQLEWQAALQDRTLSRIDVAFSHDQPDPIGVEDRLFDRREALIDWIDNGASLYACGSPENVERARSGIARAIATVKAWPLMAANGLLADLERQGRFSERRP